MQLKSEKQSLLICFLVVLLAYWPVTSFQFAIKNDFFRSYFPLKYYISEALSNHTFPAWNPYLNYGFPIYGDMSEAWWNPGTWLVAATAGYNVWSFTLETIIYLILSAWGMHLLSSRWTSSLQLRSIAAVTYACSGFMTGHLQHFNWTSAAGILPFLVFFLLAAIESGRQRYLAATAFFATWYATIAHPGLVIGAALFLPILITGAKATGKQKLVRTSIAFLLTAICCAGMLYGYAEVLPDTNRSSDVSASITTEGATTVGSWISLLLPLAAMKSTWLQNDISLRNTYIGLLFLPTLWLAMRKDQGAEARRFLFTGLSFLLIASDLFIPVYKLIPPLNYVRLGGEFRIFAIFSLVIASVIVLDKEYRSGWKNMITSLQWLQWALVLIAILALVLVWRNGSISWTDLGSRSGIKQAIADIDPNILLLTNTVLVLAICYFLTGAMKQQALGKLMLLCCIEMVIISSLTIPFTGVGRRSVKDMGSIFQLAPKGIPIPSNLPEAQVIAGYPNVDETLGEWGIISKQLAQKGLVDYPLFFASTVAFTESDTRTHFLEKAPFFLSSGSQSPGVKPLSYSGSRIKFSIGTDNADTLILKQNHYPGWSAELNGGVTTILKSREGFLAIPLIKGKNELEVSFHKPLIKVLLILQFIFLALMAGIYVLDPKRIIA